MKNENEEEEKRIMKHASQSICSCLPVAMFLILTGLVDGCGAPVDGSHSGESSLDGETEVIGEVAQAVIACSPRTETGYDAGRAFVITVITVDGKPVERETANHFAAMQRAAAAEGIGVTVVSGFRTMAEQQRLYACYVNCSCNDCNLAARPGYSNHQSGRALDLNTSTSGVASWLNSNASRYGFARTVSGEPWHWEWVGGGISVDACGGPVGTDGCTATERNNASKFGCACVDHKGEGGMCPGDGCTALEVENAAKFGCACVDHKGEGGMCPGDGCTELEKQNAANFGCACVDHQGEGGMCPGDGCTELEKQNAAKFGCFCVDHHGSGGACPGTGCTQLETQNCAAFGLACSGHECVQ